MITSEYKVFIPSAGLGTRLGDETKNLNKALITITNKPGISHIIDKVPKDVEIVIAIGHLGSELEQFLTHAYPDRKITKVIIENYDGPGSGLGRTLLDCAEHLQCPFIFCSNDTIVDGDISPPSKNWIGYSEKWPFDNTTDQFRTVQVNSFDFAVKLNEKGYDPEARPYIGLAGIASWERFWDLMRSGVDKGSIEIGESYALSRMLNREGCMAKSFTWYDTGNLERLKETRTALTKNDDIHVLPKNNEAIWFVNGVVIKYSKDKDFIRKRVERAKVLQDFVPKIVKATDNMYSYLMVSGHTMSSVFSEPVFKKFLDEMSGFWSFPEEPTPGFKDICMSFYKDKTFKRIQQYYDRFNYQDQEETINGIRLPTLEKLLSKVEWDWLAEGVESSFHGDLHFENILVSEDYKFVLLDWRQDFNGLSQTGDLYYDLAKLLHGMIVSHKIVNDELFKIVADGDVIDFDILRSNKMVQSERLLQKYVKWQGLSWTKVKVLTALIFLNIAALHHYPYSKFLFYLGKSMLAEVC